MIGQKWDLQVCRLTGVAFDQQQCSTIANTCTRWIKYLAHLRHKGASRLTCVWALLVIQDGLTPSQQLSGIFDRYVNFNSPCSRTDSLGITSTASTASATPSAEV